MLHKYKEHEMHSNWNKKYKKEIQTKGQYLTQIRLIDNQIKFLV